MLKIAAHTPGQRLLLVRTVFPWRLILKLILTLFFLPFLAAPFILLAAVTTGEVETDGIGAIVVMVVFFAMWFAFLFGMIWFASWLTRENARIELDRRQNALVAREIGRLLWLSRTHHIPFDRIRFAIAKVRGNDGHPLRVQWTFVRQNDISEDAGFDLTFRVEHLDQREKAIALSHDMARVLAFTGRRVVRSDHLETALELHPSPDGDDVEPIPDAEKQPSTTASHVTPTDAASQTSIDISDHAETDAPAIEVGPFDPESFKPALPQMIHSEIEWHPGERVRLYSGALPIGWRIAATLGMGALAGVVLTFVCLGGILKELGQWMGLDIPLWQWGFLIGLLAASLTWYRLGRLFGECEAVFDWSTRTAHLRIRGRRQHVPFEQVQAMAAAL
ncbi:MAG: hypothetical protein ACOC9P_01645, partial [bacterium]